MTRLASNNDDDARYAGWPLEAVLSGKAKYLGKSTRTS